MPKDVSYRPSNSRNWVRPLVEKVGRQLYKQGVKYAKGKMRFNRQSNQLDDVLGHSRPTAKPKSGAGASVSRKVEYRSKRYSRVKRRPVKIKKIRNRLVGFVKDVVKCQENFGVYKRTIGGDQTTKLSLDDEGNATKMVWTGFNKFQANNTPYTSDALKFTPLSAKRILDAASVLYNNKTPAVNYESSTNNFDYKVTKIEVAYASYKLQLTNNTEGTFWVTCYEAIAKESSQVPVLEAAQTFINDGTFSGTSTNAYFGWAAPSSLANQYKMPINMSFSDVQGLDKAYHFKKVNKKLVKPGHQFNYAISERDFCVELYKKTYVSTDIQPGSSGLDAAIATYPKGERQLLFVFEPLPQVVTGGTYSTVGLSTLSYDKHFIWGVRTDEYFKIMQPRNTLDAYAGNKVKLLQGTIIPSDASGTYVKQGHGFVATSAPVYG